MQNRHSLSCWVRMAQSTAWGQALWRMRNDLFIGRTDPAIFAAVRSHLTEEMFLVLLGRTFQLPNPRGAPCKLTLTFQFKDSTSDGIGFLYGSESEGPPREVADFVTAAVLQTDPWYEDLKRNAARRKKP